MLQENIKKPKKEMDTPPPLLPVFWTETSESVSRRYQFEPDGQLSVSLVSLCSVAKLCPNLKNNIDYL